MGVGLQSGGEAVSERVADDSVLIFTKYNDEDFRVCMNLC